MSVHVGSRLIFFLSVVGNFFRVLSVVSSIFALCRYSVNPIHTLFTWTVGHGKCWQAWNFTSYQGLVAAKIVQCFFRLFKQCNGILQVAELVLCMLLVDGESFPTTCRNAAVSCRVVNTLIQLVGHHTYTKHGQIPHKAQPANSRRVSGLPLSPSYFSEGEKRRPEMRLLFAGYTKPCRFAEFSSEAKPSLLPSVSVPANTFILSSLLIQYRMRCDCGYEKTRLGGGGLPYISYNQVQASLSGRVFAPFWSQNEYTLCPFLSGIGYGFSKNHGII